MSEPLAAGWTEQGDVWRRALARVPPDGRWVLLHGDLARQLLPVLTEHRAGKVDRPEIPGEAPVPAAPGAENWGRSEVEGRALLWKSRTARRTVGSHLGVYVSLWVREARS